jgi:hypothetical protein
MRRSVPSCPTGGDRGLGRCRCGRTRRLLHRHNHGVGVDLGHSEALRECCHRPGGRISQRASRGLQHPQEDMNPLMSCALTPAEESSLHDLERRGLQIDEDTQEPILGRRQRAVAVGGVPTGGTWLSIETPYGQMGLEGGLKPGHELPKLLQRETGQIEPLGRAALKIDEASCAYGGGLRSLEATGITNRDELYWLNQPSRHVASPSDIGLSWQCR